MNKRPDETNSLSESGRNSKKKKKKNNKRNEERKDTAEKKSSDKGPPPSENNVNTGKKAENRENNKKKEKDLRETLENKKTSKMMSGSQSNPDFKTPSSNSRNDDINVKRVSQENARSMKKNGSERVDYYEAARKKNNRHSYHDNYDRRDTYRYQNDNGHREGNRGGQTGGRDLRRGQSFGFETDRRSERGPSAAKENTYRQHYDYRPNSPSSWNWKGGRGKGGGGNSRGNSRVSSPSRSQRGNSPQSSRGNSRRNSPSSNFRTDSPVHHTQVYYR